MCSCHHLLQHLVGDRVERREEMRLGDRQAGACTPHLALRCRLLESFSPLRASVGSPTTWTAQVFIGHCVILPVDHLVSLAFILSLVPLESCLMGLGSLSVCS